MELKRVGTQLSIKRPAEWFTETVRVAPSKRATGARGRLVLERNLRAGRARTGTRTHSARHFGALRVTSTGMEPLQRRR